MFLFGAITSSIKRLKNKDYKIKKRSNTEHLIHKISKEQYYEWVNEGKCGSCGADSGEFQGICDECRWS